ncbi:MAG: alpha/beta hydrolase [Alphaproteobacteria bacterium]|jgi:haloacetate dehalogenase|nr:alpha/beta hydrolase [Alphaproteobacteria bacterium]
MFKGFERLTIEVDGIAINLMKGGKGRPLLLLHGYPQSHAMWHLVAPLLAQHFTVVVPDLRGYGDSAKPASDEAHMVYSKRATAADQVGVMKALGFETFGVVGHDRGGRVGHRMALDFPDQVNRLAVLDIVPTLLAFEETDQEKASGYYHWFFLSQPPCLPEHLIGGDPVFYLHWCLKSWGGSLDYFMPEAMAEYERCFSDPDTIRASCEDYRAGATIDLEHDRADLEKKVTCPVFALWGERSRIHKWYDVGAKWRERASDVTAGSLDCHHFMPEEDPEEVTRALFYFLRS